MLLKLVVIIEQQKEFMALSIRATGSKASYNFEAKIAKFSGSPAGMKALKVSIDDLKETHPIAELELRSSKAGIVTLEKYEIISAVQSAEAMLHVVVCEFENLH